MEHASGGLTEMAIVLSAAVLAGLILNRLRQPPVVGFILAGVVLGPTGFGLVQHDDSIQTLADLGVLMLLFIIGMELRLQSFRLLLPVALGVTAMQIAMSLGLTIFMAVILERSIASAIAIGLMLSISSTALAMKMMEDSKETQAPAGRLALAILIAQDLAVVPMLLVTEGLGEKDPSILPILLRAGLALALLAGFMATLTRIKSFRFPFSEFFLRNADIGTLGVLGLCFTAASISGLLGLSPALGAFLMGLAVGHSTLRRTAVVSAQPVQSILLFTFFLSVGLLIDLDFVLNNLGFIALIMMFAVVGRTVVNFFTLVLFRRPAHDAFLAALFLAPIGEFSFVLAAASVSSGALDPEGHRVAITVIALSLLASPIWFATARRVHGLAMRGMDGWQARFPKRSRETDGTSK